MQNVAFRGVLLSARNYASISKCADSFLYFKIGGNDNPCRDKNSNLSYVSVAQGTEHRSPKAGVGGSNPLRDTKKKK